MTAISATDLCSHYGSALALDHINFEIERGEIIALLGRSGSGKTTLLRTLAGLHQHSSGTLQLGELTVEPADSAPPEQRDIGYVFQDHALFPHLTANQNIRFKQRLSEQQLNKVIEALGLQNLLNRFPHELSGGQQQRIALARALSYSAPILLMDEPFASLDESLRESLIPTIKSLLHELGTTCIIVTHDQYDAFKIADRVAFMANAQILQIDTPNMLYHQPNNEALAEFLGRGNWIEVLHDAQSSSTVFGPLPSTNQTSEKLLVRHEDVVVGDDGVEATILASDFEPPFYVYSAKLKNDEIVGFFSSTLYSIDSAVKLQLKKPTQFILF